MLERPNPELETALDLSRSDPEQAANVLRIAAYYLRRQESLPTALAFFLAEAFEGAMRHASMVRGTELLMKLNLVVPNRRQKANFEYVGMELEQLLRANVPKGQAVSQVAESFGISDASVKRKHTEYLTYKDNEAYEDSLDYEAELRHYEQQAVNLKSKKKIPSKRSKEAPPFALDKK